MERAFKENSALMMHIMMGGTKAGFYPVRNGFKLRFRALENRKGINQGCPYGQELSPVKWGRHFELFRAPE